jgi:hypothetical protein
MVRDTKSVLGLGLGAGRNLQVKVVRPVSGTNDFVACVDAIGYLDRTHCLLEWNSTSSRYPEEPNGLLALDPQPAKRETMENV